MRKLGSCLTALALLANACGGGASAVSQPTSSAVSTATTVAPSSAPGTTTNATTATTTSTTTTTTSTTTTASPTTTTTSTTTTASPTTTSTTTTSTTVPRRAVRRIATGGDSLLLGVLPPLQGALEHSGYEFEANWFIGFLAARSADDWAALMADLPDVLILDFAPWELAALERGDLIDLTDPTWPAAYVRDFVEPRIAQLRGTGTEVIWIGPPAPRDPVDAAQYRYLNAIWQGVVEREPWMIWLDAASLVGGPNGEYVEVDETVSPAARLFQTDGQHLCPEGGRRLADGVLAVLTERHGVMVDPTWAEADWANNPKSYDFEQCEMG